MKGKTCITIQQSKGVFQEFEYPDMVPSFNLDENTVDLLDYESTVVDTLDLAQLHSVNFVPTKEGN